MKVIGKTEEGYLLQASARETANLIGYYSEYSLPDSQKKRHGGPIQIGDDIQVHRLYSHLTNLAQHEARLNEARAILQTVSQGIGICIPIIRDAYPEKEGSES